MDTYQPLSFHLGYLKTKLHNFKIIASSEGWSLGKFNSYTVFAWMLTLPSITLNFSLYKHYLHIILIHCCIMGMDSGQWADTNGYFSYVLTCCEYD